MTIIHYVGRYLPLTETFIYNYIISSIKHFDNVIIVCDTKIPETEKYYNIPEKVQIYTLNNTKLNTRYLRLKNYINHKTKFFDLLEQIYFISILIYHKPSIVHCHFGTTGLNFMKLQKRYKTNFKYVTSFYGYDISELIRRDINYSDNLKKLWIHCNGFFAEGPILAEKIIEGGAKKDKVLINPIVIDSTKYPTKSGKSEEKTEKILIVGRFVEKKGFHLFLISFGQLIKDGLIEKNKFKINIIGYGPFENDYKKIINEYDYKSIVDFKGALPLDDCIKSMRLSDFLIHPSLTAENGDSEGGAPTILIEAQMLKLPILTSNHADIPNIMGYDDFIANEGDIEDIKSNFMKLIKTDCIDTITSKGRDFVLKNHDLKNSIYYSTNLLEIIRKEK